MHKFLKNLGVLAVIFVFGFALYQIKQVVDAYSSGVITSISSGVLYSSGTQFDVSFVGLSGHSNGDQLKAFLSDSPITGDLDTKPRTSRITLAAAQPGRTGTIDVGTGYQNFTGDTLYLHILVTDPTHATTKGSGAEEITFVGGGGGTPILIISEFVAQGSGGDDWIEFLSLSGDRNLSDWTLEVYDNTGGLTTYNLTGGTIPASGLLVLQYDFYDIGGMVVLKDDLGATGAKVIYNDSGVYNNDTQNYAGIIPLGKSATQGMGGVRSINDNPNPGWFNDAVAPGSCSDLLTALGTPPTLNFIANCLSGEGFGGVLTNMGDMQDPTHTPSEGSGALYFEKPGRGKITFKQQMNLTDHATTKLLQAMGQQLDMQSGGRIGFDPSITGYTSETLRSANAELVMYNVNQLGVYEALSSGFIFAKDSDTHEILSGAALPDLSGFTYTGLNSGTLSFMTNHFTSFEIARVRNITQTIGYDTIQEAIDSVSSGDIITVASGVYTENVELKNGPFTLSGLGSPTINGTITLKNSNNGEKTIIIQGFAPIDTLYADLGLYSANQYYTLRDAIGYIASGGTIFINGGSAGGEFSYLNYIEDDQVTIDKTMSIIGTGTYRPNIYFDDTGTGGWLVINAQNVIIRNINFYANYTPVEIAIQTQQATGVIFNNCVFDSLILENTDTTTLIATGNYRGGTPVLGTDYSGNVSYTPRCLEEACTTLVDDDATLSNLIASGRTLSGTFSSGVTGYTINVPYQRTGTITATPTTNNSGATRTGDNYITILTGGTTGSIVITVTASDTTTTIDYTIVIARDPASTDATLSALTVSTGTLDPSFSSGVTGYEVNFPYSRTGLVTITGTKNDTYAVITGASLSLDLTGAGQTGSMFITVQSESGNTQTYTVTITRSPASTDANLSGLTLSVGTLSGTFSSGVTGYTVNFPWSYTGRVIITGEKHDTYAVMTGTSTGIHLTSPGMTGSISLSVQAENGTINTYTVTITRSPASTDANLSVLTVVTGGTLSGAFSSGTYTYTINLPYSQTGLVEITGTKNHTYAVITGTNLSLDLTAAGQTGSMFITVQSESGDIQTYTVTIVRDSASTDANLSALTVSGGTLSGDFSSGTYAYTVNFPYSQIGSVSITGTVYHPYAFVSSGIYSTGLTVGSTGTLFITVQSESGDTQTYTVTITRDLPSTDANLSALTVSTGALSGTFSSGTYAYTVNFPYQYTGSLSITGTVYHPYAFVSSGIYSANLTIGSTGTLFITVQSESGDTQTYTVTITRDLPSTDTTLSGLVTSTGTLYGFTGLEIHYNFSGVVTITPTATNIYATLTGIYSASLALGETGILTVIVTAEDGMTTGGYSIEIFRTLASTDANLSALTVSTGTLSGTFSSGTYAYTVNFPYQYTGSLSITGTKNYAYASIISGSYSLTLTKGSTGSLFITVQSESGDIQTYTVTITRTPASTDANLSSLAVSTGSLSGNFSSGITSYTVQMLYSYIGTITATPIANHEYATVTGTTSLTLTTAGSTGTLESTVTAEDESTTKTYTINVTRDDPPSAGIDAIDGTVTITGGSVTISGSMATGATFGSTGTLHIVGDTTNDYLEISVSGFIITASGGTWDGVLLSPIDLLTGDSNNATLGELGLTDTSTTTYTLLITIQAGSNTDSLTASGGYFNISFVVPGGTNGDVINLYRSENGSTWVANTPDTTCTLNSSLVCAFRTDHLSFFSAVLTTTSGGGGGGGGGVSVSKDNCPDGDLSPSFYDSKCDVIKSPGLSGEKAGISGSIVGSTYPRERNNAYLYAHGIGITTIHSIQEANMEGGLIRAHMAKMMVNYAIKVLKKTPDTGALCIFDDIANQSTEMRLYIKLACQLGLMGVNITSFDPNGEVTRAQFGTVLSRALWGQENNISGELYYLNHLNALKNNGTISNTNPYLKEIRGYVMLMLMRAEK